MPSIILREDPYFTPSFTDFRRAKSVEIPRKQVSFHCKGIFIEDKVTTSQCSQLRPKRKSNDKNKDL